MGIYCVWKGERQKIRYLPVYTYKGYSFLIYHSYLLNLTA